MRHPGPTRSCGASKRTSWRSSGPGRSARHPTAYPEANMVQRLPLTFLVVCLLPGAGIAQAPSDLQEAMRQRTDAVVNADAATWERLTADDFTVVLANGTFLTKGQRLALLKTEKP